MRKHTNREFHPASPEPTPAPIQLIGHEKNFKRCWKALCEGREGAFLFCGPEGIGKKQMVLALAQRLVCISPLTNSKSNSTTQSNPNNPNKPNNPLPLPLLPLLHDDRADTGDESGDESGECDNKYDKCDTGRGCGVCAPCQRILSGSSESFLAMIPTSAAEKDHHVSLKKPNKLQPETKSSKAKTPAGPGPSKKRSLKIEAARRVISFLQLRSPAKQRLILIDDAHLLTQGASSALLKILEEAPQGTFFFLVTHAESLLPPTLMSRLKSLHFSPLSKDQLKILFPKAPDWALRLSGGSPETLERWTEFPELPRLRQQALQMLLWSLEQREDKIFSVQWKTLLGDRQQTLHLLHHWWTFLRDMLSVSFTNSFSEALLLNEDLREETAFAQLISHGVSPEKMRKLYKGFVELEQRIHQNKDVRLSFEYFYFQLCE